MVLLICLVVFAIGCCLSSYEENSYAEQREARKRHEELMALISKRQDDEEDLPEETKHKVTRRRIAQDREGNVLAEEITEETL